MEFGADIHFPQRTNRDYFRDPLNYLPVPPISQRFLLSSDISKLLLVVFALGMSQSDLQDRDRGGYGQFLGICNFERGPRADFYFNIIAQFVAGLRCARNVTLSNLWIKCLQIGNNFN